MNSNRNSLRSTTYRNGLRLDLFVLLALLLLSPVLLAVKVACEANVRTHSGHRCQRIEEAIHRAELNRLESADRTQLLTERYALEDRVARQGLKLVPNSEVEMLDLRPLEAGEVVMTASR